MYKKLLFTLIITITFGTGLTFAANNNAYVTTQKGLLLRERPSVDAKKIIIIPYQSEVYVLEVSDIMEHIDDITSNWVKIRFNNQIGYVYGCFLKVLDKTEKTVLQK
jgi:hypothetical protein